MWCVFSFGGNGTQCVCVCVCMVVVSEKGKRIEERVAFVGVTACSRTSANMYMYAYSSVQPPPQVHC